MGRQYETPQAGVEQVLAGFWQELLKKDRVGRHDVFFELGGQSLLTMRLIALVAEAFSVQLTVTSILEHSSLLEMARLISLLSPNDESLALAGTVRFDDGTIE
jgi:hypothetical protein